MDEIQETGAAFADAITDANRTTKREILALRKDFEDFRTYQKSFNDQQVKTNAEMMKLLIEINRKVSGESQE